MHNPTGLAREEERPARAAALRSLLVIRRFTWKVGFFVCFSAFQAGAGNGFTRHLVWLTLAAAVLSIVLGHWSLERIAAPHYTYFDEAAWFMLLSFALGSV